MSDDKKQPELAAASLGATIQYGVATIQGLLAGNGGAATALIALKAPAELPQFSAPVIIFAVGFKLGIICGVLSYLSQGYFTQSLLIGTNKQTNSLKTGQKLKWAAITAGVISLLCLMFGTYYSFYIGATVQYSTR